MNTENVKVSNQGGADKKNGKGKNFAGDAAKVGVAAAAGIGGTLGAEALMNEHPEIEEIEEDVEDVQAAGAHAGNGESHGEAGSGETVYVDPNSVRLDDDDAVDVTELDDTELHPLTGENDGDEVAFIDIDDTDGVEFDDTALADFDHDTDINIEIDDMADDYMADADTDMGDHDVLDDIINA